MSAKVKNNSSEKNLLQQVALAVEEKAPLRIHAGDSKKFYGNHVVARPLDLSTHCGILNYHPSELVVTVRAGTLLSELEAELESNHQMLAFEPPQHSKNTTIGGVIACGLSGPGRVSYGAARDFVLGVTIINGLAKKCRFGGQVIKNVAGFDAARLMVGAQGTLGVLLDVSLKVLPIASAQISLYIKTNLSSATEKVSAWRQKGLAINASCFVNQTLYLRLSGAHCAVTQTLNTIKKTDTIQEIDDDFWLRIKNQSHPFFTQAKNLWRCSHQSFTPHYGETEHQLIEWFGALRWVDSQHSLFEKAENLGGHAQCYPLHYPHKKGDIDLFQPLPAGLLKIQKNLKQAFDPYHILNPNRLYDTL